MIVWIEQLCFENACLLQDNTCNKGACWWRNCCMLLQKSWMLKLVLSMLTLEQYSENDMPPAPHFWKLDFCSITFPMFRENTVPFKIDQLLVLWTVLRSHLSRWNISGHGTMSFVTHGLVKQKLKPNPNTKNTLLFCALWTSEASNSAK